MESWVKICAVAVVAAVLTVTVRARSAELALALTLLSCAVLGAASLSVVKNAAEGLGRLADTAGMLPALLTPVVKCCGVCFLTQTVDAFCREAGANATAKLVDLAGGAAMLCAAMPLVETVMQTVREMLAG